MDALFVTLRLVHIVTGVFWAGTLIFFVTLLEPSIRASGPEGGKVMMALMHRGYLTIVPVTAVLTIVSGLWMYWIVSGHFDPSFMRSRTGQILGAGAGLSIIALIVGLSVMRPAAVRIGSLAQRVPTLAESDHAGVMAEMDRLRSRARTAARIVATLLLLAVAAMAVARYVSNAAL